MAIQRSGHAGEAGYVYLVDRWGSVCDQDVYESDEVAEGIRAYSGI